MMLEASDIYAGYGRIPILHGISLQVSEGQSVGVLGHNGMGKTTLVKALMGVVVATSGKIIFDGEDLTGAPSFKRAQKGIGYVPQGRRIFPGLTALENLRMGAVLLNDSEAIIDEVLEFFPLLKPLLNRQGGVLSGGEQQLLALARCLCGRPRLLLLDEPTEGIQPSTVDMLYEIFERIRRVRRFTLLLVEQNLDFITANCERVLILQKGEIVRDLSRDQLASDLLLSEFVGGMVKDID